MGRVLGTQGLGWGQLDRWEENQERGVLEAGRKCFTEEGRGGVSKAMDRATGPGEPHSRVVWVARA